MLLAIAMQVAADPIASPQDEIVVIAQKQKYWRGYLKYKKDVPVCKTKRSTGDKAIDKIGCDAMIACFPKHQSSLVALAKQSKNKGEYSAKTKAIYAEISECVVSYRDQGISELADMRVKNSQ